MPPKTKAHQNYCFVFQIFGFLPDGSGKDLSLTRTVMTPLPDATACLTDVPTA